MKTIRFSAGGLKQQGSAVIPAEYGRICGLVALLAVVLSSTYPARAQYDPSAQFSPVANPNGVWSYGFERPLGSPFSLLTLGAPVPATPGSVDAWMSPSFGKVGVLHNGTPVAQTVTSGTDNAIYQPGMLGMHPGPNNEYAVVQFTAPANGLYTIQGVFEGIDTFGTTTDVHLLMNNVVVSGGNVVGFGPPSDVPLAAGPFLLNAGDTLAYAVGFGGNGPSNDTTALLNAQVASVVPEPSSLALLGFGAALFALRRARC